MTRTLEPAEYWRLRAICSEAQRCRLLALQARAELATAHKKQTAALDELGRDASAPSVSHQHETLTRTLPD